jgi:oligosaccharide reducing-end xylanase
MQAAMDNQARIMRTLTILNISVLMRFDPIVPVWIETMSIFCRILCGSLIFSFIFSSCGTPTPRSLSAVTQAEISSKVGLAKPAFETGAYRNLFAELLGKGDAEIQSKIDIAWDQLFYGNDGVQRVYYPVGADMAYLLDTGNGDVRTEGMSYGMMIAVQLNRKEEFDRIWKWTKTYMYQPDGPFKGYFAWHCRPDGAQIEANPASDGEEWFAMSLFFAAARWGSGKGVYDYRAEAQSILDTALHADNLGGFMATNLFDDDEKQVVFVPMIGRNSTFTDPSYHLPAYYELWARWADKDNQFWSEAASVSREFFKKAAHPKTGLMPDYANFDGTPYSSDEFHKDFRFDAFRTFANVAVDYAWFSADAWQVEQSNRVLDFLAAQGDYVNQYSIDGTPLSTDRSSGMIAMVAVNGLAADPEKAGPFVQALWDLRIPSGKWRYYDGLLYMLALLYDSGQFRIYTPVPP